MYTIHVQIFVFTYQNDLLVLETQLSKKYEEPIQCESDDESNDGGTSQGQNESTESTTQISLPYISKTAVCRRKKGNVKNTASAKPDSRPKRERKEPDRFKY